ncbi:hypothetical protein ILUMI_08453 [Ignelater luminosus]|uniref:DDE Tnp4 domain-containing protein n=1 Tax=Ignelater luminosus TaxID=2038154 RepID=A0A8K0D1M1_IGNLU|nr:hypothetical protein ILUMI_08453 [Ignelater luminosus]
MVSRSIKEVTDIIREHLAPRHIRFPNTANEINRIKEGFFLKHRIGGVVGCIDCTHVPILAPAEADEDHPPIVYYNRKGYYSLNVQLICDVNMKILAAKSQFPGSVHDSAIWAASIIRTNVERKFREGNNIWLMGDSGYPLEPWLLTPILGAQPGTPEARYTLRHSQTRNVIERCNGLLKMRFRCLSKKLLYHPIRVGKIVYAAVVLHNLAIDFNLNDLNDEEHLIIDNDGT